MRRVPGESGASARSQGAHRQSAAVPWWSGAKVYGVQVHGVGVHGARVHGVGVHGVPPYVMMDESNTQRQGARCRGAQRQVHCAVRPCPCDVIPG